MPARRQHRDRPSVKERAAERREQLRLAPAYPDLNPKTSIADAFEYQERLYRDHRHCSCGPPWCCKDNCPGWTTQDEVTYGYLPDDGYLPVERTT